MKEEIGRTVLIVDDNEEDVEVFELIFNKIKANAIIHRCADGQDAINLLFQRDKYSFHKHASPPCLILLDLNMAGIDGRDVLKTVKDDQKLKSIPVIVFSTSSNPKDVEFCYQHGANGFMTKPVDFQKLEKKIHIFCEMWLENMLLPNLTN